jgi:hypothetical protein
MISTSPQMRTEGAKVSRIKVRGRIKGMEEYGERMYKGNTTHQLQTSQIPGHSESCGEKRE